MIEGSYTKVDHNRIKFHHLVWMIFLSQPIEHSLALVLNELLEVCFRNSFRLTINLKF
jgi:hypothetical protein